MLQLDANGPKSVSKVLTFTGAAGLGAVGAVPLFSVTGQVLIERIVAVCTTDLVGATATLALGVVGSTALFIAATTATEVDATEFWVSTTPTAAGIALPAALKEIAIAANIIGTVAVAAITAGVIRVDVQWRPLSPDGNVA